MPKQGADGRARSVADLARADIRDLPLYAPDQATCAVDVSDNTNLWGAPPAALQALRQMADAGVTRYPSLYGSPLRDAIRRYAGAGECAVVVGCGSDDVLDAAMRAFGGPPPSARIAFSIPTFSMVPTFARMNGLEPVPVPLCADLDVDAERLVRTGAEIIYVCAPNNPTATTVSRAALEHVVERAPGVVILDEAYAEFAARTHVDLIARSERLLVTRTFSKAFGLAGLRVGYGLASAELAGMVERAGGPYKVNAAAAAAVSAALRENANGLGWVRAHVALALDSRTRLVDALLALGLAPLPSDANFVFVPTARASSLAARMRGHGVLVRVHERLPREIPVLAAAGGAGLRIGVGPWPTMQRVLDALGAALQAEEPG